MATVETGKQREHYDAVKQIMRIFPDESIKQAFDRRATESGASAGSIQTAYYRIARELNDQTVNFRPRKQKRTRRTPSSRVNGASPATSPASEVPTEGTEAPAEAPVPEPEAEPKPKRRRRQEKRLSAELKVLATQARELSIAINDVARRAAEIEKMFG